MKRTRFLWILAIVITTAAAYYQRVTGPTYPLRESTTINGKVIQLQLERSHGGDDNAIVRIKTGDPDVQGALIWRRYKTNDEWEHQVLLGHDGLLTGVLPHQPPAGKLEYRVTLLSGIQSVTVPPEGSVVIRFRGDVPLIILLPHVFAMFGAMLLSTRAGLEFFNDTPKLKRWTFWTLGFLAVGGLILGPIVQKYAFGEYWTGWPYGTDLTDNKTLIALLGWAAAAIALYKSARPKVWALGAALLLFIVYLIPHSVWGSEIDYSKIESRPPAVQSAPH